MYFNEHNPPHFHAAYGEYRASFEIRSGKLLEGEMPKTAIKLINQWRKAHTSELLANWERARKAQLPKKIKPLE